MIDIDVDDLTDNHEGRHDFRRANGAPMVSRPDDPSKFDRYRRPSSYGKPLDDEEALVNWRIWKAMDGVARSPALQAAISATKDDDRNTKKDLRERALDKGAANERADLGTALHAMTARIEDQTDTGFEPPEQFKEDLDAYMAEMKRLGLVSEYVEVQIVNDDFRAAGTADRIYRLLRPLVAPDGEVLPPGTLVLGDIKTGEKMDFGLPAYCVQMAIYATGQFYDIHNECRMFTPPIHRRWMLLMHVPVGSGRCDAMWLDINVGLHGAFLTFEVLKWRNQWKTGKDEGFNGYEVPDPFDPEEAIATEFPGTVHVTEIVDGGDQPSPEAMIEWCSTRIAAIGRHREAKKTLLLAWPDKLPTPKQGIETPEQLTRLLDLLDMVEDKHSLPWASPDPRLVKGPPQRIPGDLP